MSDAYIFIVFVNGQVDNTFSRKYTADKYASILREHLESLDSPLGTPEVTVGKYTLNEGVENSAQAVFDDLYGSRSEDRKSTRLNSSHVAISYDVFCLKNKIT